MVKECARDRPRLSDDCIGRSVRRLGRGEIRAIRRGICLRRGKWRRLRDKTAMVRVMRCYGGVARCCLFCYCCCCCCMYLDATRHPSPHRNRKKPRGQRRARMQNRDAVEHSACCDAFLWCSGVFFFRLLLQRHQTSLKSSMGREKDNQKLWSPGLQRERTWSGRR